MDKRRRDGVILIVVSATVFSSAGIFTKGVPTGSWDIVFWRGIAAAAFTLLYLALRGKLGAEIKALGGPALAIALIGGAGTTAFIPAFKYSSVANVALIYASAPFVASAIAWLWLRERPEREIVIGALAALGGVAIIVWGGLGGGTWFGDGLAFVMTLAMSTVMVIYRKYPETTAALPAALSSIVLLPVAMLFGAPFAVPNTELLILIAFGLVFAVASVTLSEGARRLAPGETALLSSLEVPLAPLLAFLVLAEVPVVATLFGGAIVFCAVVWATTRSAQG